MALGFFIGLLIASVWVVISNMRLASLSHLPAEIAYLVGFILTFVSVGAIVGHLINA
jgi:uncharacterized membrane protein